MRNTKARYITMTLGCLLVVVIVCSQFFSLANTSHDLKKPVTTEQTEDTGDQAYISLPSFSLPSPVHVQINLDSHCLFEILFENKQTSGTPTYISGCTQKFFTTLFRVIISPNAP
jgi:hypothetical protein